MSQNRDLANFEIGRIFFVKTQNTKLMSKHFDNLRLNVKTKIFLKSNLLTRKIF